MLLPLLAAVICAGNLMAELPASDKPSAPDKQAEAFTKNLVTYLWKFDHGNEKGIPIRFFEDGRCSSVRWLGSWSIVAPNKVRIVKDGKSEKATLLFASNLQSYDAIHFDGARVRGRRSVDVSRTPPSESDRQIGLRP